MIVILCDCDWKGARLYRGSLLKCWYPREILMACRMQDEEWLAKFCELFGVKVRRQKKKTKPENVTSRPLSTSVSASSNDFYVAD